MIGEVRDYTLALEDGQLYTVMLAKEIAAGLLVYRIPDGMHPSSPHRWRIGHEASGRAVADCMTREDAIHTAELFGTLADWTQDMDTLRATVDADDLFAKASRYYPILPASPAYRMAGDVSRNGTYTDEDVEAAAAEFKAAGYNAADILLAMTHTVPWMGLSTEAFNEVHNQIAALADAA